ncbi:MAG: PAS domain-containing protein [Planctomycetes bacterium]|nr:PAS domain-containing protein [Planctomycetota bacterium]
MSAKLITEHRQAWSRMRWLLCGRLLVAVTCMAVIVAKERGSLLLRWAGWQFTSPLSWAYALLVSLCVLNVCYLFLTKYVKQPARFAFIQILVDVIVLSGLIYCTGGIESYFNVLYFACILAASIVVSGRSSIFFASLSTVLLSIVCTAYFVAAKGWGLPFVHESWLKDITVRRFNEVYTYLVLQGLAFHGVAFLSNSLASRLGRANIIREALLRDMSEGVIAIDTTGTLIFVNEKAKTMLGFSEDATLTGKRWDEVFKRQSDSVLKDVLLSDSRGEHEIEIETPAGTVLVNVRTSVLYDDHRQRIGILGDLTPRVRMEQAEKRADYMEEIAELAAGIAHEIRNPLASIRSCVQELSQMETTDPDSRQLMDIVCSESDRLDGIISDFLQFARMRPANPKRCEIGAVLEDFVVLLEKHIGDNPVEIRYESNGSLYCMGDEEQLKQVFLNLGVNAIDAMLDGGKLTIKADMQTREGIRDGVEITFTDTGGGISPDRISRIFSPFFTTKPAGTGMGLPVVRRIVRAHGGEVSVESTPGVGTTFRVWVPCSLASPTADLPERSPQGA